MLLASVGMLTVALLLAGCAGIRGTVPDAAIVPQADCGETGSAGRVPSDFVPVSVALCDDFGTVTDEDGVWSGPATRHLEGDLVPLIEALNQADDPRWLGPCTAHMVIVPQIWLADAAGRAVHVTYPVDGCGQPKTEAVNAALALLEVTAGSVDRQNLTESAAAIEAGCRTQWTPLRVVAPDELADVPGLDTSPKQPGDTGSDEFATVPLTLPPVGQLDGMRLCRYAADPNPEYSELVGLPVVGTFTNGSTLNAEEGRIILTAAEYEVMPLIACLRPATEFVVAHPLVDGQHAGGTVTIEVDGCQRLFGTTGFTLVSEEILALVRPR
ncbi:hypothetical protein ACX3O0_01150 [Homoserinimonas sp. A447]